jgi:hypothetical protein
LPRHVEHTGVDGIENEYTIHKLYQVKENILFFRLCQLGSACMNGGLEWRTSHASLLRLGPQAEKGKGLAQ